MPSDSGDSNRYSDRFSPTHDKDTQIPKLEDRIKSLDHQHTADAEDWQRQRIIEIENLDGEWEEKRAEIRESEECLSFENEELQARIEHYEKAAPRRMCRYEQLRRLWSRDRMLRTPGARTWQRLNQQI